MLSARLPYFLVRNRPGMILKEPLAVLVRSLRFATVAAKGRNPQQSRMAASRASFTRWFGVAAKFHGPLRFGGQLDDLLHSWR
jgi:hypothetical protein